MGLAAYHKKRNFNETPEPKGKVSFAHPRLFVIQKHAAKRLHYDFRLELNGTLKSWAVPNGPCLDPTVKRLAVEVEDHPIDYGSFEGLIPAGHYGAGTVMLWDKGVWIPLDKDPFQAYKKGHLRFEIDAGKLKGGWDLIRFKNEKNQWLLIKRNDDFAKPFKQYDITKEKPNSILTHYSIDEITKHTKKNEITKQKKTFFKKKINSF